MAHTFIADWPDNPCHCRGCSEEYRHSNHTQPETVTLSQLAKLLQHLLNAYPHSADYPVMLMPHGSHPRQHVWSVKLESVNVLLEARH